MSIQAIKGVKDILPEDMPAWQHLEATARALFEDYGFSEIRVPIFEYTELFARSIGASTDIVEKEMYTFEDRDGRKITLRPEGTAGVVRAFVEHTMYADRALAKLYYLGPMFRHERPQKGRQRQFHQIGVELLGVAGPLGDIETIAIGAQVLEALGILPKTMLEINTLGDQESRGAYRAVLVRYFGGHRDKLSEDSLTRLERNPLRILDSKDEGDRRVVANAPTFADYLTPAARDFFAKVRAGLDALGIPHQVNPRLVRGLDYYCHTAFEFTTTALGAQGTVLAGGRYDGLIGTMGGPETPGVGWAAGIERLAMLIAEPPAATRPIAIVPIGEAAETVALTVAHDLRRAGCTVDLGYSGNLSKRMKRANKLKARYAVILGDDELQRGTATLRDLDSGEQEAIPLPQLQDRLAATR